MAKIEILRPYGMLNVGEEIDVDKPVADLLVARKTARYISKPIAKKKKVKKKRRN